MANAEVFDSYFRRADLDKDGRISGQEAVGFFQGAGLPQMTLAKIWQFADQGRTGFLSRVEFYNALKLVTVAQTGREITPELVRAALTGPAAAQIPPPRISSPAGQPGGASSVAPVVGSQGAAPVQGAGGPAAQQGVGSGQGGQARSVQGSNDGASARAASMQGNGLAGAQGGAPAKQFSPHTNSAPSAPMAGGGYGVPAKQLAPQTNSLSTGGSGGPQLTSQTSSLSRYPPSAGQVQVAPTGFSQQGWARPPAAGGQPVRPSLGSLFTTNSAWPAKESNPPPGASQGPGSNGKSTGPGGVQASASLGQSRPVTPASSASTASSASAGVGTTPAGQGPAAAAAAGPRSAKEGVVGAGFNGGVDLFSGGFKASGTSGVGSSLTGAGAGANMFAGSGAATPTPVPAPGQSTGGGGAVKQLEESMFSAPAVAPVQVPAPGGVRGASGEVRGPSGGGVTGVGPGSGARPQGGPVMGASWPQMSGNDVEKYSRVFAKVDTDKDGKITGEQARELFLSWQLPRGVLKQVWDLSDQDNDSMLSLREFCTALYFMERFREGRALPSTLPAGIHPGDTLQGPVGGVGEGPGGQSGAVWRHIPGVPQTVGGGTATGPAAAVVEAPQFQPLQMPERAVPAPGEAGPGAAAEEGYKSKVPALEENLVDQLSRDEQEMLKTKHKAAEEADKKVYELDREIQDYKEKIELYRAKLQEIILFKSRCDNQLDEVKERVASERREMDTLGKKYDQRFKAAGEVSSRLQAEEAAFRDIQEKKMELYTAIAKLDKGGDGKESLENRANDLSANLDELKKTLYERGRALGVRPKSAVPIEVSTGFEGVPDNAMEWVEDWDKFDDEGFTNVRDIMDDLGDDVPASTRSGYAAPWGNGESLFDDGFDFSSDPTLPDDPFKAGHDESREALEDSPEHGVSTSDSRHKDYTFNASLPSGRYSGGMDSEAESGGDGLRGEATFDTANESFGRGGSTFDSRDPFGESASAWGFHDEDSSGDFRASWGQAGSSTQTSMELSSSRGQTRFGRERGSIADSLDMDALRVSSPRGALFEGSIRVSSPGGFDSSRRESSPGARGFGGLSSPGWSFDRNGSGNDDYKNAFGAFDSPKSNAFGSPRNAFGSPRHSFGSPKNASYFGNSSFDAAPSLFGGSPGGSKRDDPYRDGGSFMRFDSFGPGAAPARVLGGNEGLNGVGHNGEKSLQRFDSTSSMKPERERRRGFQSDDESDPFGAFGGSGAFGAGGQTAKQSNVWSAF